MTFLGGSVVARKPYLNQTLRSTPSGVNNCLSPCVEVLICTYKQTDDECFYLWDTIRLNFK